MTNGYVVVLSAAKVSFALLLLSGMTQGWPFQHRTPGHITFPDAGISAWRWEPSFADPRDLSGSGIHALKEEFGRTIGPTVDGKLGPGYAEVIRSANKAVTKAPAGKHNTRKNNKTTRTTTSPTIPTKQPTEDPLDVEILKPISTSDVKEDIVVFPDREDVEMISTDGLSDRHGTTKVRETLKTSFEATPCENDVFCDDTEDYPGDAILRSLRSNYESVKEFFYKEEDEVSVSESPRTDSVSRNSPKTGPYKTFSKLQESGDIGTRIIGGGPFSDSDDEEQPLCTAESITRFPRRAKTDKDKWLLVVNHANYTQGVKVEKCQSEGSECFLGDQLTPLGYKSVCRQKYSSRMLVVVMPDGTTSTEVFRLPSCCTCNVKLISPGLRSKFRSSYIASTEKPTDAMLRSVSQPVRKPTKH